MRNAILSSEQHIVELTGIRGVAVLMVLLWHFIGAVISPSLGSASTWLSSILVFGRTGVDLFFVLSGFLIIGILVDKRDKGSYFATFYLRRAARILPPYLLLLVFFWGFTLCLPPNTYFNADIGPVTYLLFLQNWYMSFHNEWGPSASSVTWSVAIEEQFYLVFPVVVYLTPVSRLRIILWATGAISAAARAYFHLKYPENHFAPYVNTLLRLDELCLGGLIALAFRREQSLAWLNRRRPLITLVLALCVGAIPFFLVLYSKQPADTMYYWGHLYLGLLYGTAILVIVLNRDHGTLRVLHCAPLQFFGTISYSVYLFHPMVIGLFFVAMRRGERLQTLEDLSLLIAAFVCTIVLCWISYNFLEKPILNWARQLSYGPYQKRAVA
ncbi:acyltransferase family protein [Bradyrhizobium sp. RDM4]|uniref:acyltransferase family protein n=1 Tax=Bradyrhizobium sp. RDM4 TaxID=3378765 RepID=UPI0038FD22D1